MCTTNHRHACHDTIKPPRTEIQKGQVFFTPVETPSLENGFLMHLSSVLGPHEDLCTSSTPECTQNPFEDEDELSPFEFSFNMLFEPEEYGLGTAAPLLQGEVRRAVGLEGFEQRHRPRVTCVPDGRGRLLRRALSPIALDALGWSD